METTVVHCKREKYDVYIGRPGFWGNPFVVGRDGVQGECVELYRNWVKTQPQILSKLWLLKGKKLGCWCKPKACHGDVLAELVKEHCPD